MAEPTEPAPKPKRTDRRGTTKRGKRPIRTGPVVKTQPPAET